MEHAIELSVARTCSNPRRMQPTPTYAEWIMFFLRMLTMQHHSSVTFTENSNNGARNFQSRNMFRHVFCKTDFWLVPCLYVKEWVWSAILIYLQLTCPWYIEVLDFLLSVMEKSTVEHSYWDWLPPEIQEYIQDLAAREEHWERLKEVWHIFWIKNPFGSCSRAGFWINFFMRRSIPN